jgi:perosamine synthetase
MEVTGKIPRYNSIGKLERVAGMAAMNEPLSGYLGGEERGGFWVRALEDKWAESFKVAHAVACNSATSGILAACAAIDLKDGDDFAVSTLTMSATAAAPTILGARPRFGDVEDETFCWNWSQPFRYPRAKALIITNLFGHPAMLRYMRAQCDAETEMRGRPLYMIEDNAQSPLAIEHGQYAGTVGHIGVFSLNVHKHFQSGEGGIIVTNSDELALRMRMFINHSELCVRYPGLNLRMTEVTAAIALAQLSRAPGLVRGRIDQAERILAAIGDIPGLRKPVVRLGCSHVYYTIPFLVDKNRAEIVHSLQAEGVPLTAGYTPIHRLPAFGCKESFPVADALDGHRLFYFENCAWDPTPDQVKQIGNAFQKVFSNAGLCREDPVAG